MKKIAPFLTILLLFSFASYADENEEVAQNAENQPLVETLPAKTVIAATQNQPLATTIPSETVIAATAEPAPGFTTSTNVGPENEDLVDPRILRDFIESRGLIACRQKCGQLTIAGDARARYIATGEKVDGYKQRGFGTTKPINLFKSEFNLFLDYVDTKSWVSTKVKWAVVDGVDGGSLTKTELDRAFIGYDIYECDDLDFYIELGRSRLDYIFDSRVEFSSFFDGIHLYYTNDLPRIGTFVIHGGPFVVDSLTNHYAWVMETYIDEWADTGLILKYSLIDWRRRAPTKYIGNFKDVQQRAIGILDPNIRDNPRYRFLISQMLFGYTSAINFCRCKTLYLYGAVLANHDARKSPTTANTYANKAWYVGFTLGKLCKACDWSIDANYQYVQAQAVPEFDLAGIGHGNAAGSLLSDAILAGLVGPGAVGFTNFKGIQVSALYALTDALSLRAKGEWTTPINPNIGGTFNYKSFEMAAIYAF